MRNPRNLREAAMKDGLPRKAFAYAPTADPTTWKLPILTASGAIDSDRLPGAVAALSEGGFRGQRADIPASDVAAVKRKLRAAYRKWKGADAEIPDTIKEAVASIEGFTIREAVVLLDRAPTSAQVIVAPNGDTLVVPNWDGAFGGLTIPMPFIPAPAVPPVDQSDRAQGWHDTEAAWDVEDAADVLGDLVRLKKGERGEDAEVAMLDKAIDNVVSYIRAEASEIGKPPEPGETCGMCDHRVDCDCTVCACSVHGTGMAEARAFLADPEAAPLTATAAVVLREVGRRNSARDQQRIQQTHDFMHDLGAVHAKGTTYAGMAEAAADVVEVRIEAKATPEVVRFREAAAPGSAIPVTLQEAAPLFDEASHTVWITPIRPGWGNKRDNNYYPASTLREATEAGRFNHVKMFRDHPRKSDERDLPERSVKDWFATTREAVWDETRQEPRVPVKVHDDTTWRHWADAPEQVAFSVLGNGSARPGAVDGRSGRIIESIVKVGSVDWVTEAGAGGAIAFAESAADEEFDMDLQNLTADQLREANPALYAQLTGTPKTDAAPATPSAPAAPAAAETTTTATPPAAPTPVAEAAAPPAWAQSLITRLDAIEQRDQAAVSASRIEEAKKAAKPVVADVVGKSTLPGPAKQAVLARFTEAAVGEGQSFASEQSLREAVAAELALTEQMLKPFMGRSNVTGLGPVADTGDGQPGTIREAVTRDITTRWGTDPIPAKGKYVFSAEEIASGQVVAVDTREARSDEPERSSAGASSAPISDASQPVQDRIAARLGA